MSFHRASFEGSCSRVGTRTGRRRSPHISVPNSLHNGFELDVLLKTFSTELTTHARALEAAKRRVEVAEVLVNAEGAGAHTPRDIESSVDFCRPDRAGEAVVRVVGDANRIIDIVVRNHCQHWSKDLFPCNSHPGIHVREH